MYLIFLVSEEKLVLLSLKLSVDLFLIKLKNIFVYLM